MSHATYVQMIQRGGFFAVCSTCGSDNFPNRQALAAAEADAREHGQLTHVYDSAVLESHDK